MKPVSLKTQRRIMFIPYINIANLFIWLYNDHLLYPPGHNVSKAFMIILTSTLPLWILSRIISGISPTVGGMVYALAFYLGPLVMGYRLIRYQEQLSAE